jgi:hypothetical protein
MVTYPFMKTVVHSQFKPTETHNFVKNINILSCKIMCINDVTTELNMQHFMKNMQQVGCCCG